VPGRRPNQQGTRLTLDLPSRIVPDELVAEIDDDLHAAVG
jgi:hypothetical protein